MSALTDKQIANLVHGLLADYNYLKNNHRDKSDFEIYLSIREKISNTLKSSTFYVGSQDVHFQSEVNKIYHIFLNSMPLQTSGEIKRYTLDEPVPEQHNPRIIKIITCSYEQAFLEGVMFNSLLSRWSYETSYNAHHPSSKDDNNKLAILFFVVLGIFAVCSALIAFFYLLYQLADDVQRFIFSEGALQATLSLLSIMSGGMAGFLVGVFFAAYPVMLWAAGIGLVSNPAGIGIATVVILSILAAAGTEWVVGKIAKACFKWKHTDALDSDDPYRYGLEREYAQKIAAAGLDPMAVKIAIVHLTMQIRQAEKEQSSFMPNFISIFTKVGSIKRKNEAIIRALRNGALVEVTIDKVRYNLVRDFNRERLNESEKQRLIDNGLNVMTVEFVLTQLRSMVQEGQKLDQALFKIETNVLIRDIYQGKYKNVDLNGQNIDLTQPWVAAVVHQPPQMPYYQPDVLHSHQRQQQTYPYVPGFYYDQPFNNNDPKTQSEYPQYR